MAVLMRVLGLMSGTSMDGIDAAVISTDGRDVIKYGETHSIAYPEEIRAALLAARGWGACPEAEALVLEWHGARLRREFAPQVDLIGFHGQTVAHDPDGGRTRQLGDGAALADIWNAPVVWDFRSKDMRHGGQGAPLAPFFHFHALRMGGCNGAVAVVNIGGVGNVTWADLRKADAADAGALLAFDTGPGNALLDDLIAARIGGYDRDGRVSAEGRVDQAIVDRVLARPFFNTPGPKSLDRDDFADVAGMVGHLSTEDAAATLASITAQSIAVAARHFPQRATAWLVTGGGRKNPTIMTALSQAVDAPVFAIEEAGLNGDMLEAQAFAWLAVRAMDGLPISAPGTTGCTVPVTGGRISYPGSQKR